MHPTWFDLSYEEKEQFIRRAIAKRDNDLLEPSTFTKKRVDRETLSDKLAKLLTPEEIAIAEKLGLSKRSLKATLKI